MFSLGSCARPNPVVLEYSRYSWGVTSTISVRNNGEAQWLKSGETGAQNTKCESFPADLIDEAISWHAQAEPVVRLSGSCEDGGSRTITVVVDGVGKSAELDQCPGSVPGGLSSLMGKVADRLSQCQDEFYESG